MYLLAQKIEQYILNAEFSNC